MAMKYNETRMKHDFQGLEVVFFFCLFKIVGVENFQILQNLYTRLKF